MFIDQFIANKIKFYSIKRINQMSFGQYKLGYEVLEGWEQLPEGWSFVEVAGVAINSQDRV